jgi:hypothetical protein
MDMPKAKRAALAAERKKQRDREAARRRRGETGKISALKPWEYEGINRRTWERSGKAVNGLALALLLMAKMDAAGPEADAEMDLAA